ncbi:unnamed protein product [Hymenolepis diminuta]|uniref:Major facilitator superfamily (MFS) profile domain-containing protein n=1 Tax=Hymenolepis diminuta TaxID=6216 RepID=A0A564YDY3_HYMDI|nr:unnamed protein product [Hymenolepis diminuta]
MRLAIPITLCTPSLIDLDLIIVHVDGYAMMDIKITLDPGVSGLAVAGYAVSVIELAPKFAGLIMGFANSISTLTGILSTVIATVVVHYLSTGVEAGWIIAMSLAAGSQFFAAIFFLIFASSQEQEWAKGGGGSSVGPSRNIFHPSSNSHLNTTSNQRRLQPQRQQLYEADNIEENYR